MLHLFGFCVQLSALLCEQVQLNLDIFCSCICVTLKCHYHPPLTLTHKTHLTSFKMSHFWINNSCFAVRGWEETNFFCVPWQLK